MAEPVSFWGETINDNTIKGNGSPETTTFRVPVATLTAANYVAKKALIDALAAATIALLLGVVNTERIIINETFISAIPAATPQAQRENKFLVRYHDSVSQDKFRVSLGTANLSLLMTNSEFIDLTAGAGQAYKNAFEAIVVSPDDDSHSVVVDSIQFVGRNT